MLEPAGQLFRGLSVTQSTTATTPEPSAGPQPHGGAIEVDGVPVGEPGQSGDQHPATSWMGLAFTVGLLALLGWYSPMGLLIVLAILFFVFMHELGHYLAARATGMKVTEFFIGFGPRIFSFRRGETEFGLKAILAGAYVRIIGMNNLEEVPPEDEPRTYREQSYPRKVLVAAAGSLMHFAMAIVLLFVAYGVVGRTVVEPTRWSVSAVSPESAASQVGIEPGERIIAVDGRPVETFDDLVREVAARPDESVTLELADPDGSVRTVETTLGHTVRDGRTVGFLGVGQEVATRTERDSPPEAAWNAVRDFPVLVWESIRGVGAFVTNFGDFDDRVFTSPGDTPTDLDPASRPVSVVGVVQIGTQVGTDVILWLAIFNVFIGVFNLLPLLPFDGGHIAVATYERIRSVGGRDYQVDVSKLVPLIYLVVFLLAVFGIGALWLDIANPINL